MPRLYRTETIEAIYNALLNDAALVALVGKAQKIIRNDHSGRIRRLEWRAPSDFMFVQVKLGPGHSGDVYRIQNFGQMTDANRSADYTLECVWNSQDDDRRDAIETQMLTALSSLPDTVAGILSVTFRSATGRATIAGQQDQRDSTSIILTVTYELSADDI